MEADWYIDPLGRYEGRFFDGTRWTHQVSDRGTLAFDPDWPPVARGRDTSLSTSQPATSTVGGAAVAGVAANTATRTGGDSFADDVRATASTTTTTSSTVTSSTTTSPATTLAGDPVVRTSSVAESPARQVAVVSSDKQGGNIKPTLPLGASGDRAMPSTAEHRGSAASEPLVRDPFEKEGSGRRWLYILGGLLLLAGLALALLPRLFGGDDEIADTDTPVVEVVQDDEVTEEQTPDDEAEPAVASGDEVAVGAVTIRNGQSALGDLTSWHAEQAASRNITLPDDADCWFAKRGEVAEQAAFCGPVGVDDEGRTLYDQLAVVFEDAGPQVVSVEVDRDSLIPNVAIDQGRELVDRDGEVIVGGPTQAPRRGERIRGN